MNIHSKVLELLNSVVLEEGQAGNITDYGNITSGFVTNFIPSPEQYNAISEFCAPLRLNTLFSREERTNAPLEHLLTKQIIHYIEVYGLGMPGLFDLEYRDGEKFTVNFIKGITQDELHGVLKAMLYNNAPIKDSQLVMSIINYYGFTFDVNMVQNNEMMCLLYDGSRDTFADGDAAVRYLVYLATDETLLIKSKEVIAKMKMLRVSDKFLNDHAFVLSTVFNRHKPLILALKNLSNKTIINNISRMSKNTHVPIRENITKTFIAKALNGEIKNILEVLSKISIRDKFNYLNLIAVKKQQFDKNIYNIRNGKMFVKENNNFTAIQKLDVLELDVLLSINYDLSIAGINIDEKKILLDNLVDYGLPISAKQTTGRLPNGTQVAVKDNSISSGVYWEDEWGARDLDLSAVDSNGARVGWGSYSGYNDQHIIYSGDVTSAYDGAMEFLTSNNANPYAIYVNIFNGEIGSKCEIVVGDQSNSNWIDNVILREKIELKSKQTILGFVKDNKFTVYSRRYSNSRVSTSGGGDINTYMPEFWTVRKLFDVLGIKYDVHPGDNVIYDIDLSYKSFSYNKLEDMFKNDS